MFAAAAMFPAGGEGRCLPSAIFSSSCVVQSSTRHQALSCPVPVGAGNMLEVVCCSQSSAFGKVGCPKRTGEQFLFKSRRLTLSSYSRLSQLQNRRRRARKLQTQACVSDVEHRVGTEEALPHFEEDRGNPSYDWKSHWYAVQVAKHTDTSRPHPVSVLGRPYVLWYDANGEWRCFVDECPHRLVPLSEGRIDEMGRLQCAYHGWAFDGTGACKSIPQADEGKALRQQSSGRACARAVPSTTCQGIIFIWPDEHGWEKARAAPPPLPSGMFEGESFDVREGVRDLMYSYEYLVENVIDLSHLPYAHHGVAPLDRSMGKPVPFTLTDDQGPGGFEGVGHDDVFPTQALRLSFHAPNRVTYARTYENGGKSLLNVFTTPVAPGRSRAILQTATSASLLPQSFFRVPDFVSHFGLQDIFDGDAFFLHGQEKTVRRRKEDPQQWQQYYYMPSSSDRLVVAYRQWLAKYAGGKVDYVEGAEVPQSTIWSSREVVMDRLHSHTEQCTACSSAFKRFQLTIRALKVLSFVLLTAVASVCGRPFLQAGLAGAAAATFAAALWLKNYVELFIYRGWDHATR